MLNSALLLLVRSLSAAMLMLVQKRYFVLYTGMAGEMALYLLQKVLRGDFYYWLPIDGALGLFVSLIMRVLAKTIADFTGVIHFRGPQELGGAYWTANMFLAMLVSFGSVWVYTRSDGEVTRREVWMTVGYMGGGWLTTFGLFLLLMKKDYRRTFFATTTGKQQVMDRFKSDDEAIKASVLKKNKKMWRPIREEAKTWVLSNWHRWVDEKPLWFTEAWVNKVPYDFIPDDEDQAKLEVIRKNGRRRSSAAAVLGLAKVHPTTTSQSVQ